MGSAKVVLRRLMARRSESSQAETWMSLFQRRCLPNSSSWQAVCAAHKSHSNILFMEWNEDSWPDVGNWGVDLYWTTRSDGCRYEYWSSAPGDNEYGVLVRIDNEGMIAIGMGSDDGIRLFDEFREELQENESN